jgi:hypothetical protein
VFFVRFRAKVLWILKFGKYQFKNVRVIDRQQKVMEALYLYLLQKRRKCYFFIGCRTQISVIDSADTDNTPVFPLKGMIYFGGLVLGLLLPFGIIYTDDLLDTKIKKPFGYRKTTYSIHRDVPTSDFPLKLLNREQN